MKPIYQIIQAKNFNNKHQQIFSVMLKEQGKVRGDFETKIYRCKIICITHIDNIPVAIGAIKQKTPSDFNPEKANLPQLSNQFEWELGYLYTRKNFEGQGIASSMAKLLVQNYGQGNLMASTEIKTNPAMVHILEKNGFNLYGKTWKSNIHNNELGLFLKFG